MPAVMRHVRSQPINAPAEPTRAERSMVGHLITAAAGIENARRRDREAAATRKAGATPSRCNCHKGNTTMTTNTTTTPARRDAIPPPPDLGTVARELRELREFAPPDTYGVQARVEARIAERVAELADDFAPPDTYGLRAARDESVPPPPDFARACIALRAESLTDAERRTFAPPDTYGLNGGAR